MHAFVSGSIARSRSLTSLISKKLPLVKAAVGILAFGLVASAAPIGDFGFSSTGVLVFQNGLAQNFIDWCPANAPSPTIGGNCGVAAVGIGTITAQPGQGGFSTIPGNTPGTIRDTTDTLAASGALFAYLPPTAVPLAPAQWIHNYITVSSNNLWDFTATQLENVVCTAIVNEQFCTGPFKLTQTGTGASARTSVTINVAGILFDGTNNTTAAFRAIITGQYANHDIAAVLREGQTQNGIFSNTISATVVTSAVPEPATMLLGGLGLIGIGLARRRKTA